MPTQSVIEFEVPGQFRIVAPAGWRRQVDSDVLLWLRHERVAGSGLFIDFKTVDWSSVDFHDALIDTSQRFVNNSVLVNEGSSPLDVFSIYTEDADHIHAIRTFVKVQGERTWLINLVFNPHTSSIYIVHWNGPESLIKTCIVPIVDTFEVFRGE